MYARMNVFSGSANADEGLDTAVPALREIPGSRGIVALVDRESGRSVAITLWDSEDALRASEEAADELRAEASERSGDRVESVERYEVAYLELRA